MTPSSRQTAPVRLGDLEKAVLDLMWTKGALTVREALTLLNEKVKKQEQYAYTTIMTTMDRLAKKNILAKRLEGRGYSYEPALTKSEFAGRQALLQLENAYGRFGRPALASFVEAIENVDPALIDQLRRELERRDKETSV